MTPSRSRGRKGSDAKLRAALRKSPEWKAMMAALFNVLCELPPDTLPTPKRGKKAKI